MITNAERNEPPGPKVLFDHPDTVRESIRFFARSDIDELVDTALALLDDLVAVSDRLEVAYARIDALTAASAIQPNTEGNATS